MKRKGNTKEVDELYDYLHENFEYRDDGNLIRKFDARRGRAKVGDVLGTSKGTKTSFYKRCFIIGKTQQIHRMIFLFHGGYLPKFPKIIDHDDRDKMNNRIENLEEKTRSQNTLNSSKTTNSKYGYAGISPSSSGRWVVQFRKEYMGTYDTKDEAVAKRRELELEFNKGYSSSYPQKKMKTCGECDGAGEVVDE